MSARDIAIHHAALLEHRKQLEAQILDSLILLSDFPPARARAPPPDPAAPAPADAAAFRSHVRLFQPSDYDDLVEERNVNGLCGYSLCPRPRRLTGPGGEWKLLTSRGDIVRRRDLEKWCSPPCARRALYVKVQLSETAAWERAGIPDIQIDLLEETGTADADAARLRSQAAEAQRQAALDAAALALERGDRRAQPAVGVTVREKDVRPPPPVVVEPAADGQLDHHLFIDGFKARLPERRKPPSTDTTT